MRYNSICFSNDNRPLLGVELCEPKQFTFCCFVRCQNLPHINMEKAGGLVSCSCNKDKYHNYLYLKTSMLQNNKQQQPVLIYDVNYRENSLLLSFILNYNSSLDRALRS